MGLLNNCYENKESLMQGVLEVARSIAAKSPLASAESRKPCFIPETILFRNPESGGNVEFCHAAFRGS